MVIQLNKFFSILSLLFLFTTCKKTEKQSIKSEKKTQQEVVNLDFLNSKYLKQLQLTIDESNVSDHPLYNYLDCYNEGYFTVHFIAKDNKLRDFWKFKYFEKNKDNYENLKQQNSDVRKLILNNLNQYNIFSYCISKDFLNKNDGCNEESIFAKSECIANIYFLNQSTNKWESLLKNKSEKLPPYSDNDFFIQNFPKLFPNNNIKEKTPNNPLISLYNIDGWRIMCNNYLTHLDISEKDSEMFLYSDNDIYINIEVVPEINKKNEFYIKFKNTARYRDYYPEKKHIIDNEISKTENIAKLKLKGDKLIMDWYGLYNTKTQTRDFVKECIFVRENDGVNTIELSKCE